MNVLAILESDIIGGLIEEILSEEITVENIDIIEPTSDFESIDYRKIGLIIIDLRNDYEKVVSYVENVKKEHGEVKVVVMDVRKRSEIFKRLIKSKIEGYIVDILDREEFAYIMHKIVIGKKFYDLDLLQELFEDEDKIGRNKLTVRENEILNLVVDGYNNKEISQKLYITENTVKKHVNSIFNKLGYKSRKEVIANLRNKNKLYF